MIVDSIRCNAGALEPVRERGACIAQPIIVVRHRAVFGDIAKPRDKSIPGKRRHPPEQEIQIPMTGDRKPGQKGHVDEDVATQSIHAVPKTFARGYPTERCSNTATILFEACLAGEVTNDLPEQARSRYRKRFGQPQIRIVWLLRILMVPQVGFSIGIDSASQQRPIHQPLRNPIIQ